MKFAICNEIFQGWKLEDSFAHAAKAGYDAVEIAPFTIASSVGEIPAGERKEIREAAERSGIEIAGIHWVLVKAEGQLIRTGVFENQTFTESPKFILTLTFARNPNMLANKRYPLAVWSYDCTIF